MRARLLDELAFKRERALRRSDLKVFALGSKQTFADLNLNVICEPTVDVSG